MVWRFVYPWFGCQWLNQEMTRFGHPARIGCGLKCPQQTWRPARDLRHYYLLRAVSFFGLVWLAKPCGREAYMVAAIK